MPIKTEVVHREKYVTKMNSEVVIPMLTPCVVNKPEVTVSENAAGETEGSIPKSSCELCPNSSSESLQESIKEIATKGTAEEKIKFLESLTTSLPAKNSKNPNKVRVSITKLLNDLYHMLHMI